MTYKKMTGKNNSFYGKHHTKRTKLLLSKLNMGKNIGNKFASNHRWSDACKKQRSINSRGKRNPFFGKRHTKKTRKHLSMVRKGTVLTLQHRLNIGKSQMGKVMSEKTKIKIARTHMGMQHTEATKKKLSILNTGKHPTLATRKKMSLSHKNMNPKLRTARRLRFIAKIKASKGNVCPEYNKTACEYFRQFDEDHNTKGRYAVYGNGEYYIKKLGYWIDYINFDLKLIIEWDEPFHFFNGKLRMEDVLRQKEIQSLYPDFTFKRIKQTRKLKQAIDDSIVLRYNGHIDSSSSVKLKGGSLDV